MLLRISLIIAILAGLGAGVISYLEVSKKIPVLVQQRNDEHSAKVTALANLSKTKTELAKTKNTLAQTQQDLAETKSDRDKAVERADAQSKRADELTDKLAKATQERDDVQNQLAQYKATGLTPEQVLTLGQTLKEAQTQIAAITAEKAFFKRKWEVTKAQLAKVMGPDTDVKLRADLKGKNIVVDPKWDFVVLDIGEDQGAVKDGELLVSRDGKLVAKVVLRSVQKDRSIANVMPGWKLGEPIEGDEVTPAHPAS